MTKRKPHPDNALIDELAVQGRAPSQGGSSGGGVQREVATRSELDDIADADRTERPTAKDYPER